MNKLISIIGGIKRFLPARFWLAGPLALLLSIVIMAGASIWLPHGDEHVYNLVFPVILFPLIWGVCFFYPLLEPNLKRATIVMFSLLFINLAIIIFAILS